MQKSSGKQTNAVVLLVNIAIQLSQQKDILMKINLSGGRVAVICTKFGNERPKLDRPLPEAIRDKPFRSIRYTLTLQTQKDGVEIGEASGVGYCNPADQFCRFEGRKKAMGRLFSNAYASKLLTQKDFKLLLPSLLSGKEVVVPLKTPKQNGDKLVGFGKRSK